MSRFIFRQIDYRDLELFYRDSEIRSKNHGRPQNCHQTSYQNIVQLRGENNFQLPTGGVVNDYVPFYFCPITSFSYTINRGNVPVMSPNGVPLGNSNWEDRLFIVYSTSDIASTDLVYCFSDYALNSFVPMPTVISDINQLEDHVHWNFFDDDPMSAKIPEINYDGCCKYFSQSSLPQYATRKEARMAEFLIKDSVPISLASALVCPTERRGIEAHAILQKYRENTPILVKPECFAK